MDLPLDDGTNWELPADFYKELAGAYQKDGLDAELTKMRIWLIGNPSRRKTRRGIKRFVANWLLRAGLPMRLKILAARPNCCYCPSKGSEQINGAWYCESHAKDEREFLGRAA